MKFVFFDLDETLSDHMYACQQGIAALMALHPGLQVKTVEQLETEFWGLLNSNYHQVLQGIITKNETSCSDTLAIPLSPFSRSFVPLSINNGLGAI